MPILRSDQKSPEVAIFGAGISGLTVAHELIERGFKVHVIEPAESPTEEYACQIGGMAANQFGRVPFLEPKLRELYSRGASVAYHKQTLPPEEASDIRAIIDEVIPLAMARMQMEPTQRRFALTERIQFKKPEGKLKIGDQELLISLDLSLNLKESGWRNEVDEYGITNETKLRSLSNKIKNMYNGYKNDLDNILDRLFSQPELVGLGDETAQYVRSSLDPYVFLLRIIGFTDADGLSEVNRELSMIWAKWVGDALIELNADQIPHLDRLLIPIGGGGEKPLGKQSEFLDRRRSNRVEFSLVGQTIPGEHGYRFFPSFYRHLFDTMKRTPVFSDQGELTPETAFDQLVSTPDSAVGFSRGEGMIPVKLRRFTAIKDLENTIAFFREKANFTPRDLLRLQTHFLKYLTSCKDRRSEESEDNSFWEYIHADKVGYSVSAARFIDRAPQALVAMSARETDARTQYNSVIQMLVESPLEPFVPDMTLNGTTSEAWLDRWKDYLRRKGVRFYVGSLKRLALRRGTDGREEFIPVVKGPDLHPHHPLPELDVRRQQNKEMLLRRIRNAGDADFQLNAVDFEFKAEDVDFFVMALPFETASKIIWDAYLPWEASLAPAVRGQDRRFCGPFRQLIEFDKTTGRRLAEGTEIPRHRDPCTGLPINKDDPLRDISGIQYFLPNAYRFVEGHVYYPDSPWALTSISQYSYFRDRLDLTGSYIGQQSFDIGDWYEIDPADNGTTAWNSTRQELAERTWAQAIATLESDYAQSLVMPKYYHLDDGIKFCVGPELDEKKEFMTTRAAFRGNAVLRITKAVKGKTYSLKIWGQNNKALPEIQVMADKGDTEGVICQKLVSKIRAQNSIAAAIFDEPNQIIISPTTTSDDVVLLKANGHPVKPGTIFVDGVGFPLQTTGNETLQNIGDDHVARRGEDGTITIHSKRSPDRHGHRFSVAVCSADNCLELLRGPRLTLELHAPVENGDSLAEIPREALDYAVVLRNDNPYIINVPGQWRHRPGLNPATGKVDYTVAKGLFEDCLFRRWVPAGTFMATYTRLTTMEAANESGRHAVNAILQALKTLPVQQGQEPLFNGQGRLYGDPCQIWDPEDNELSDLHTLKELDEALMREGLPHFLDILRVIEFLEGLPDDVSLEEVTNRLQTLIGGSARASVLGLKALENGARVYLDAVGALLSRR